MSRLNDLKTRISKYGDVADAIGQLTEFISILTLGLTTTGGMVTIPYIIKESSKTTASLTKLLNVLLGTENEAPTEVPPFERIDDIFYVFAQRAYISAINNSKIKNWHKFSVKPEQHKKLMKEIDSAIVRPDSAEASFTFGWNPDSGQVQLFKSYNEWLKILLISMGMKASAINPLLISIEIEARKILHADLVEKNKDRAWMIHYQLLENTSDIREMLRGYFEEKRMAEDLPWKNYLEEIAKKPTLPIWGEEEHGLGIEKIFVEPSYSYTRSLSDGREVKGNPALSIPLKRFLLGLLSGRRPSTELIFVMGGPGTGKTSLMEIFGSEIAQTQTINFILVPAKKLNPNKSIISEVQNFLKDFGHASLADRITSTKDLILAIDGFDELAHATLSSLDMFFRQANDLVRERAACRLRVILSGRPTLFATNDVAIPSGSHIVTLQHFDPDRVKQWSSNWRRATNGTFDGSVYLSSKSDDLRELAKQPMLLYLLAKMHEENEAIPFNIDEEGGLRYKIYCKILDWVCRRQEHKKIPTPLTTSLRRFLQIAGLATHQSGHRTLHWSNFIKALERSGLADDLSDINSQVHSTILSFAFTSVQERSWEFTHKSFGEALAAEAVGRVLEDISESGRDGERWKVALPVATKIWVETFGPHYLSKDILDFYDGWLFTRESIISSRLIPRLIEIFNYLLAHTSSDSIASVAKECKKSIITVNGNAVRSWFNLTNTALSHFVKTEGKNKISNFKSSIQFDKFRTGVYLSQVVSPISSGEGESLFKLTSELIINIQNTKSKSVRNILNRLYHTITNPSTYIEKSLKIGATSNYWIPSSFYRDRTQIINTPSEIYFEDVDSLFEQEDLFSTSPLERVFTETERILQNIYEQSIAEQIRERAGLTEKQSLNDISLALPIIKKMLEEEWNKTIESSSPLPVSPFGFKIKGSR